MLDAVSKTLTPGPAGPTLTAWLQPRGGPGALVLTRQVERPKLLRDPVYERAARCDHVGEMAPGAPVIEAEIVTRLGLSRTPVREVLRRLESEGMLEPRGGRGTVVREIQREEVDCVFEIREVL